MPPTSDVHLISGFDLQRFAGALFQALGVAGPMADEWARSLCLGEPARRGSRTARLADTELRSIG